MEPRTKNFSGEDTELLLSLVKEHSHVIECKKTDKLNADAKDKAWVNIETSFNSVTTGQTRSMKMLRTKYLNLKADIKKRAAAEKRSLYATGGGPPLKQLEEVYDETLMQIIPGKQIKGLSSVYDSDSLIVEIVEGNDEVDTECSENVCPTGMYNQGV